MMDFTELKFEEFFPIIEERIRLMVDEFGFANVVIAGSSCSGKTTLSHLLKRRVYSDCSVLEVSQDDYFKNLGDIPYDQKIGYMMDSVEAFHKDEFTSDFDCLYREYFTKVPKYNVMKNVRLRKDDVVKLCEINIFEGLHAIHFWKELEELSKYKLEKQFDSLLQEANTLKIYVNTLPYVCLQRRIKRDGELFLVSPKRVIERWNSMIMPMNREFVYPQKEDADIVISLNHEFQSV